MTSIRLRRRLLYLVDALDHDYQSGVTQGVVRAAQKMNADLMMLVGGKMVYTSKHLENRRFVYELAKPRDYDGVILLGTSLSSHEGMSAISPLIFNFASLPIVSIGLDIGKGCTILVNNADGMAKVTEHLLDVHHFKKFAYISGPEHNKEAQLRLRTFKEVLTKRHLHLAPEMLVWGGFTESSGEKAAAELIDKNKVDIRSVDVVVCANDSMAVGAMDEFKRRGIRVPHDVAVVGFDDIEAARYGDSPLTTVQQPLILQGEQAVERVLSSFGGMVTGTIEVSPKLVVRRSCGCGHALETPTLSTSPPGSSSETLDMIVARKRQNIEYDLAMLAEREGVDAGWEKPFMDKVIEALAGAGYREVTQTVDRMVRHSIAVGEGVHVWHTVIAALDKHLSLFVNPGTEESAKVETLLHRSRTAMAEAVEHFHASKVRELRNQTVTFNEAAIAMLTTLDANSLINAAAVHLPKLGIQTASISLFHRQNPESSMMKRFLVLQDGKQNDSAESFPTSSIAAPELVEGRPHALVVEPLCFYDDLFGVAALEYGPTEGSLYEQLGAFFSAAVKALYLSDVSLTPKAIHEPGRHIDPLTGLYTKEHLSYRLTEEIARVAETGRPLSLIILDMDDFKGLNDMLGEEMGDKAIKGIADTIKRCVKPWEPVMRFEEDTFAVLLTDTPAEKAVAAAELIKRRLKLALAFEYHGHIAASFGAATLQPSESGDEKSLIDAATFALSNSKRTGKDRVTHAQDIGN